MIGLTLLFGIMSQLVFVSAEGGGTALTQTTAGPDSGTTPGAADAGRGQYTSADEMLQTMERVAVSQNLELYFKASTADIAVRDTASGAVWLSSPYDYDLDQLASAETKASLASFISLTYFDSQTNEYTMNGYEDCISKGQFTYETMDNGVRVNLQIGEHQEQMMVPYAAEASRFEEKVINELSGTAQRRIQAFYTRYSVDDESLDPAVKEALLEQYPGLAEYDLYIMRDDATERDISVLNGYIQQTSYTAEDYADDLDKSGASNTMEPVAMFEISVEFYLENGTFVANVPTDRIRYDQSSFVLNKIRLMEFFGAGRSLNDGYLFVPDGSGSLIHFNTDGTKSILSTVNQIYGQDYSLLQNNTYQNLSQQSYMPVFGIKENDRAFLGIIEAGDAMAQVISESGNIISGYETVAVDFTYATVQSYTYEDGIKQNGQWVYMDKNYYSGDFRIRYNFLTGEDADYVGMAHRYQDYLIQNGALDKLSPDTGLPLYLETIGAISKRSSFFGIPYNQQVDITGFSDAIKMMDELQENGVGHIKLRYKGWMNGGLNNTAPSGLSIEKQLGGEDGFQQLLAYIREKGFSLFPDVNFSIVRQNKLFDGFTSLFDSPRSNDDHIVTATPPEELNNISEEQNLYSVIRPSKAGDYYDRYFNRYRDYQVGAVSISYAGNMLYSDFRKDGGQTRQQALELLCQSLEKHRSSIGELLVDGGNAYILPYAGDILNMPLTDGAQVIEDESVPFMQIVLHGYVQYAGAAVNLSDNWQMELLKSAEYGANLYFSLGYKNTDTLKDTTLAYLYSIDYTTWKEDIISQYEKFSRVFSDLQDQAIADHERVAEDVYITIYEDGTAVAVNYSSQSVTVNNVTVGPMDFSVV